MPEHSATRFDLGCGDGRIVCAAARKFGCTAAGYDIDAERIKDSEANKAKEDKEVQKRITFEKKDIFTLDLSKATVVMLHLRPELNVKLIPQLKKLRRGSRIRVAFVGYEGRHAGRGFSHRGEEEGRIRARGVSLDDAVEGGGVIRASQMVSTA